MAQWAQEKGEPCAFCRKHAPVLHVVNEHRVCRNCIDAPSVRYQLRIPRQPQTDQRRSA